MGSPPFAAPVLAALCASPASDVAALVTRPDKPRGRGLDVVESPLVLQAREAGVEVLQPARARDPELLERLQGIAPDVIVVASFGEILLPRLLDLPPRGCVNVHASLLPRHRGASPIQAAILAGDEQTGVSIQRMVPALDEGDVLLEERTLIGAHENAGELTARLALIGARAAVRALGMLAEGTARFTPQDSTRATYARKIEKEHGVVDWTKTSTAIERHVRAFTPWPGARTTTAQGADLVVLDARAHPEASGNEQPGTIVATRPALLVRCGEGALEIRTLKPAGKAAMDAAAWLRGARLDPGARLGASSPGTKHPGAG